MVDLLPGDTIVIEGFCVQGSTDIVFKIELLFETVVLEDSFFVDTKSNWAMDIRNDRAIGSNLLHHVSFTTGAIVSLADVVRFLNFGNFRTLAVA